MKFETEPDGNTCCYIEIPDKAENVEPLMSKSDFFILIGSVATVALAVATWRQLSNYLEEKAQDKKEKNSAFAKDKISGVVIQAMNDIQNHTFTTRAMVGMGRPADRKSEILDRLKDADYDLELHKIRSRYIDRITESDDALDIEYWVMSLEKSFKDFDKIVKQEWPKETQIQEKFKKTVDDLVGMKSKIFSRLNILENNLVSISAHATATSSASITMTVFRADGTVDNI